MRNIWTAPGTAPHLAYTILVMRIGTGKDEAPEIFEENVLQSVHTHPENEATVEPDNDLKQPGETTLERLQVKSRPNPSQHV